MIYSNNIIIIFLILNNSILTKAAYDRGGGGTFIYVSQDGNRVCSSACVALFSLLAIAIALAISVCVYWVNKRFTNKKTTNDLSGLNDLNDLEQQPTLPLYDSQPPAYSELTNPPQPPPALIHSESFDDAEEFYKNNQPLDALPSNEVIQELLEQDTYSSWKFIPEKILNQLDIVLSNENGRKLTFNNSKKKGLKYDEIIVQSNLPFFNPKKIINDEKSDFVDPKKIINDEKSDFVEDLHYFEVTITDRSENATKIAIGLTTKPYPYYRMPGYNFYSTGYHSDNGHKYQDSQYNSQEFGPNWGELGDTIGCGYKPYSREIFFTKDGEYLGVAHSYEEDHVWYPTIGVEGSCKLDVNFGDDHTMFKYTHARSFGPGAQGGWLYKHLDPSSKKWAEE